MGFGASVSALLETYDNCLSLLKAFKRSSKSKQAGGRKISKTSEQQSLLRNSLKNDRSKVARAYSSRVSEAGSAFAKGDSKATSSLDKVLRRLNAAIAKIMQLAGKSSNPIMDYQSLKSLSNSSRIQAIKAFDRLSRRIDGRSSDSSVVSAVTSKSSKTTKSSKSAKSPRSKTSSSKSSAPGRDKAPKTPAKEEIPSGGRQVVVRDRLVVREHSRGTGDFPPRIDTPIPTPLLDSMDLVDDTTRIRRQPSVMDRLSLMSIGSGSTKLGEIPERRWHGRLDDWGGRAGEYSAPIMYPLRPYEPVVKERGFLRIFRRGH